MTLTRNLLVSTDFSPASMLALDAAAMLAKSFGAKVTIAHVFDPAPLAPVATRTALSGAEQLAMEQEYERHLHAELEKLRTSKLADIPDVKVALVLGSNAADALCHYAEKENVDLIVIATHGRTGLSRMLIGSVAERVVRHAPCPVLTLRSKLA
jgi:nucleotide-binding universal stress UspA family protein